MTVAPDGTLWMGGWSDTPVSFDGSSFKTYGESVAGADGFTNAGGLVITPEGFVWALLSTERDDGSLYLIDPALAAHNEVKAISQPRIE